MSLRNVCIVMGCVPIAISLELKKTRLLRMCKYCVYMFTNLPRTCNILLECDITNVLFELDGTKILLKIFLY